MKKSFLIASICMTLIFQTSNATIRFVATTIAGLGDGSSWVNASNDLQTIINASSSANGDTIFVAGGVYKPTIVPPTTTTPTSSRDYTFLLKQNVKIYGNFVGTETDLTSRNLYNTAYKTILSGDLNGNDGANFTNITDNAYHVVVSSGNVGNAVLDGFTITAGNADGSTSILVNGFNVGRFNGGGICNATSSPTIINCVIISNTTGGGGAGGMINTGGAPMIINSTFTGNKSPVNCGGMTNVSSSPTIIGCAFIGNKSGENGGGIGNFSSSPLIVNCTFSGNSATSGGGGIFNIGASSQPTIKNVIIWGNNDGILNTSSAVANVSNSLVQGLTATTNGNLNGNTSNPLFVSANATDYTNAPFIGGNYQLQNYSPCIDRGTTTNLGVTLPPTDIEGNQRIIGSVIDMGAYESNGIPLAINTLSFKGNVINHLAHLQWQYSPEESITTFIIERSDNGRDFQYIGMLESSLRTNLYNFQDKTPLSKNTYYRLKTETNIYSKIIILNDKQNDAGLTFYPIPASTFITLENTNTTLDGTEACIVDIRGNIKQKITIAPSQQISTRYWPAGAYLLKLKNMESIRFVIE